MSYEKHTHSEGDVLTATVMNEIENGIEAIDRKRVLIWENSDPSGFDTDGEGSIDISIPMAYDGSAYNGIEIIWITADDGSVNSTGFLPFIDLPQGMLFGYYSPDGVFCKREFQFFEDAISFYNAEEFNGQGGGAISNHLCVPIQIYGIRI